MSKAESIDLARRFRKEPTAGEEQLWKCLRGRRLAGLKFRRQHPFGGIITDFYCAEAALVVEVDGKVHQTPDQQELDRLRDAELRSRGLTVVRISNEEIENDLETAIQRVMAAAHKSPPSTD